MQSQEKEKEKKTNELCETQDFRESGITNNGQEKIETTEKFLRGLDEIGDKGYVKMMKNLIAIRDAIQKNLINCTRKENDPATKKLQKLQIAQQKPHKKPLPKTNTETSSKKNSAQQ